MQKVAHEKSFLNLEDAIDWFDDILTDWVHQSGWEVVEGTVLRFVNHHWQVFVCLEKKNG